MRNIYVSIPDELLLWIARKADAERRDYKQQIVWMLEQLKRQDEAAATEQEG